MRKKEAEMLRDENKGKLIGNPFDDKKEWTIKDLIISPDKTKVSEIYQKMYDNKLTNETAILGYSDGDFDVYVISHQWPWGSGDLLYERLESYLKNQPI
jgi:hypothetical protein